MVPRVKSYASSNSVAEHLEWEPSLHAGTISASGESILRRNVEPGYETASADEADEYELLREVYDKVEYDETLPIQDAVSIIEDQNLQKLNADLKQKQATNASNNPS